MATILVIEDELILLGLISSTLRQDGHVVIEASDPMEALSVANDRKQEINLILTEVSTKPITGLELATRLVRQKIPIPVLFMSGFHSVAGVLTRSLGERTLIEKPFTAPELKKAVKNFLSRVDRDSVAKKNADPVVKRALRVKLPAPVRTLFRQS
jgi:DNA-binding response OmpR family regulator